MLGVSPLTCGAIVMFVCPAEKRQRIRERLQTLGKGDREASAPSWERGEPGGTRREEARYNRNQGRNQR